MNDDPMSLARTAQAVFGLEREPLAFIRHNENITCRVGTDTLLRVHVPRLGFDASFARGQLDECAVRQSELRFLETLAESGLSVQTPRRTRDGALVARLPGGTCATALSWLEGRSAERADVSPEFCFRAGQMLARFHQAARGYEPQSAIQYDGALCERLRTRAREHMGWMDKECRDAMDAALRAVREWAFDAREAFIPVHADVSLGNLIITPDGLSLIDFSLFGLGHPMMDTAGFCCHVQGGSHRAALLRGYEAAGGVLDARALDCCFALSVLLGVILHADQWKDEDWLPERLIAWQREIFEPVAAGKRVVHTRVQAKNAAEQDAEDWLALAASMADSFPGLERTSYADTLHRNISRGTALCVREDAHLAGVLLYSPRHHMLSCMAVRPEYRRFGVATALIERMLKDMSEGDVSVTTFREGDPMGAAPRALYTRLGFEPGALTEEFGYPTQVFTLKRP